MFRCEAWSHLEIFVCKYDLIVCKNSLSACNRENMKIERAGGKGCWNDQLDHERGTRELGLFEQKSLGGGSL